MKRSEYVIDGRFTPFTQDWLRRWLKMPEVAKTIDVLGRFRADKDGIWEFGTVKKIAEETGFSERGTRKAIHYLRKKREIRLSMLPGRSDGKMQFVRWPLKKKGDREQTRLPFEEPNRNSDTHFETRKKTGSSGISKPKTQGRAPSRNRNSNRHPSADFGAISQRRMNTGGSTPLSLPQGVKNQGGTEVSNLPYDGEAIKGVTLLNPETLPDELRRRLDANIDLLDENTTCTLSIDKVRTVCPSGSGPTIDYFSHKTGRDNLTLQEVVDFHFLWRDHWPSVIQEKIEIASERFRRKGRPVGDVTVTYVRNMLKRFKTKRKGKEGRHDGQGAKPRRQLPKFKPRDRSPEVPSVQR